MPREPLRTTGTPASSNAAATSSAPTETAAASPGTKTLTAPSPPLLREGVDAFARQPAVQPTVDGSGRAERAVAQAEDLVDLDAGPQLDGAVSGLDVQRLGADRLAGLGPAQGDDVHGGRLGAEVLVEGHHAVHLGDGEVEHLRDRLDVLARDVAELVDHLVQDGHQGASFVEVVAGDGAHERDPIGRGRGGHGRLRTRWWTMVMLVRRWL